MQKYALYVALAATFAGLCSTAEGQSSGKVPKIGFLGAGTAAFSASSLEGVLKELRALGYIEGKNVAIEPRYADNKLDRLPALATELVQLNVDVLLTPGTPGALAAKGTTKTIPIVFYFLGDPIAFGLVDSLARPGGNITGLTILSPILAGKRLELIKETIPKLSRVALLWNPKDENSAQQWKESRLAALDLGLQLHSMEVSSTDKYEGAFKEAVKAGNGALAATLEGLANSNQKLIAELAAKNRLPAIYARSDYAESGGLISYGADPADAFKRAAFYVDKILKGAKPADLPVEQPKRFELVINLTAAKQIGLTIPPNVLARADRVIR